MFRIALTVGLLTLSSTPEAHPLPPEVKAARVLGGTVLLVTADAPAGRLTLLPEGVYFTAPGYEALDVATKQLQANLHAMEARARGYEVAAVAPCPEEAPAIRKGWSTSDMLVAVLAGLVVGAGGVLVLQSARTP